MGKRKENQPMNFSEDAMIVVSALERYLEQSRSKEKPAILQRSMEEIQEILKLGDHLKEGDLTGHALESFLDTYLDNTTRLHHPGYLAHQVGTPHPTGALGSLIDGLTNNPMAIYEMGPAAAAIEFFMINLLLSKIGWQPMPADIGKRLTFDHGSGVMTHGGSLANMTALLAARNHLDPSIRENGTPSDLVILAPEASHYSVAKAAGIIGIGEHHVIELETDACGNILVAKLDHAVQKAAADQKRIVALAANACSTGTGRYDPIDEIADFCNAKGIWLHIDGAHGAAVLFSRKYRSYLKGIQKADSVILDAHKMLRTPAVCACLLVKDARTLDHVFEHKASYLFHEKKQPGFDFIQQAIECTKAGLGLKFYLAAAAMGERGIEQYLDRQYDLTMEAYTYISGLSDFEVPCQPQSNILCFRLKASDDMQLFVRNLLIDDGGFYISSTELQGKRFLRIVLMNPDTSLEDIKGLIEQIRAFAARKP
jgi:L-2,4-diaminobutyrate decarboxylase